jgi:hypothetical protein
MTPLFIRKRIIKWELLRLPFNAVCAFSAWLAWTISNDFTVAIDERPPAYIHDSGAILSLFVVFIILNIAYSLVYAVEFIVLARSSQTWSRIARSVLFCIGCIIGFAIASGRASSIADDIAARKWMQTRIQQQTEENIKRIQSHFIGQYFESGGIQPFDRQLDLSLNEDGTYCLKQLYPAEELPDESKLIQVFEDTGHWSYDGASIILKSTDGKTIKFTPKHANGGITLSDGEPFGLNLSKYRKTGEDAYEIQ